MHIVSYRGPGMAGGVSAALARAWESNLGTGGLWWHLTGNEFNASAGAGAEPMQIAQVPQDVIKSHYKFCNDFIWPIMHDLPQYAHYHAEDHANYNTFNETIGWCLVRARKEDLPETYFVQDYQLALIPEFLKNAGFRSLVFWHIPWPKNVHAKHAGIIAEIARGLLSAEIVGFHTQEYADNFFAFVQQYLPEYACSFDSSAIWSTDHVAHVSQALWASPDRYLAVRANRSTKHVTRLVVAPLGIDFDHWTMMSSRQSNTVWHPALMRTPFVLSVDRADYTKGVTDRILAIDKFFEQHPEWQGRIVFAQICGKTRGGLPAFDQYWSECQQVYDRLKDRWSTDSWQPVLWIESSFSHADLALAYRSASAMLVTAVRDGLNLTAKEYVACQGEKPGVLALSDGTGAYDELGSHAVGLQSHNVVQMADAIYRAVSMEGHERAWRMAMLKDKVRSNTLSRWWYTFSSLVNARKDGIIVTPALRETS